MIGPILSYHDCRIIRSSAYVDDLVPLVLPDLCTWIPVPFNWFVSGHTAELSSALKALFNGDHEAAWLLYIWRPVFMWLVVNRNT